MKDRTSAEGRGWEGEKEFCDAIKGVHNCHKNTDSIQTVTNGVVYLPGFSV